MLCTHQFLIFIALAIAVTAALHYYAWVRLVRDPGLVGLSRTVATAAICLFYALMIGTLPLSRSLSQGVTRPLIWAGYIWMGMLILFFFVMVGTDVLRTVLRLMLGPPDPERRVLLGRMIALSTLGTTSVLSGLSLWSALRQVGVRDVHVTLPRLPASLSGLRIVQLTDLHIGPTINGTWLREVVQRVNALQPDLIAITGDLVDGRVDRLAPQVACLRELRARHGVYFVTGNHEYYSGVDEWIAELTRLGVRVLRNERVEIRTGPGEGQVLDLAGVDDHHSDRFPGHGPDLPRALLGRDPRRPLLLLAHQPAAIAEAAEHGVDLQLSGHTHGGQLWPWRFMVLLQQPYVAGLHRHGDGHTQIYVSNGTGYWGPPMRLGVPAEITHLTLLAAG